MTKNNIEDFMKLARKKGIAIYCRVGNDSDEQSEEESKLKKIEKELNKKLKRMWMLNYKAR